MRAAHRTATVLAGTVLVVLVLASPALSLPADGDGNYTQILCANPANEEGLDIAGMPDGLSNPADIDSWQISASGVDCGGGRITPGRGVPLAVGQTNAYAQGTWSALLYEAPANATINAGTIYRAERAEGPNDGFMGIIQQGGDPSSLYSLPRNGSDQGDWFAGNVSARGSFASPFAAENAVNLTVSPDARHWDVNATCDPNGNNDSSCTLNAGQWEYRIFGGEISLNAANDPQVSNISGPLTSDDPLQGEESITFSATDEGPGLAYVDLIVDGHLLQTQTIDSNDGRCVPVPGRDAYTWAYRVPCKTSVGGRTYTLDSALIADGTHHVEVVVEDAAGNKSIVLDRTVATSNAAGTPGAPSSGGGDMLGGTLPTLPAGGGAQTPAAPTGTPNGTRASASAELRPNVGGTIERPYAQRAFNATGRLLNDAREPIGDATLDVLQTGTGGASPRIIAHGLTRSDGSFTVAIPAGASRTILIAYRANSGDLGYTTEASIEENVGAGVDLGISPRRTRPTGTITLSGHVSGPIPRQGVVVELLVHYRGAWEPFRTPRTDARGDFHVDYRFQGAVGRFPFKASVPSGQAGFPYTGGESARVIVRSG